MAADRRPYTPRLPPEQRREQLLDAALDVIVRDGYAGVSMDAIARQAGVTRPVVYNAFDRLEPLLYALLDRQEARALDQIVGVLDAGDDLTDPAALAAQTIQRLAEMVAADPRTWRPILLAPEGTPRAVQERSARDREAVRERLAELVAAALGPAARDLDVEVVSHALIGMAEHFGRLLVEEPERFEPARLAAAARAAIALSPLGR